MGETFIGNYERLHKEFGIERMDAVLPRFKKPSLHIRRGIDFGHRDLGRVLDAVDNDKPFAVMSGIKPTGNFHLGTKMTADDMVYFQSLSKRATVFYCIADVEAYNDNGLSFAESSKIAVQNVADILALGLDPERAVVYKQSEEVRVMRLSAIFSSSVTNNMLRAIYGERQIALYLSALIQVGDILMPQLQGVRRAEAGARPRRGGPGPAPQAHARHRERLPPGLRVHPSLVDISQAAQEPGREHEDVEEERRARPSPSTSSRPPRRRR